LKGITKQTTMINQTENEMRVDIAVTIHKAIRKVLFDHAMLLARTDFRSVEATREAHANLSRTLLSLREHAQHEDAVVFPEIAEAHPPLAAEAIRQHDELEKEMDKLERLSSLAVIATPFERPTFAKRLRAAFNDFVAAQLTHMSFEEETIMPALWETHTDEQLRDMQGRIRAAIPPERGQHWLALLMASADAAELAAIGG
jgi:iron-sulfur cluster repair protein YtfE (RIC family)